MRIVWKRAFALLFVLALLLALAAPAMAEDPETPQESPAAEPAPTEPAEPAPTEPAEPAPSEPAEPAPTEPAEPKPEEPKSFYVSASGSDETGDGSEAKPFASLARAAAAANAVETGKVVIILQSDLKALDTARFTGRDVTVRAAAGVVTVTRQEGFHQAKDASGALYNPPMVEFVPPEPKAEEQLPSGKLTLIGVILDDAGRHEGSLFELLTAAVDQIPVEELIGDPGKTAGIDGQEPAGETDEPQPSPDPKAKSADRTELVQEAIVTVGKGGRLILGAGAELRNFGGRSAVSLGEKSSLVLEPKSAIQDTMEMDKVLPALIRPESASVEVQEGAKLAERTEKPEPGGDAEPGGDPEALPSMPPVPSIVPMPTWPDEGPGEIEFQGTERLIYDAAAAAYPVNYSLDLAMSDEFKDFLSELEDSVAGSVTLSFTLDSRLTPDLDSCGLESDAFELDGAPAYDENSGILTVEIKSKTGWTDKLDGAKALSFRFETALDAGDFVPSTSQEDQVLESKAMLSMSLSVGNYSHDYDCAEDTAQTRMLGEPTAWVIYSENGGRAGTGPVKEQVSESAAYQLSTTPAPLHDPVDGVAVVFLGWTEQRDAHIYASGEMAPQTIQTVKVEAGETITVYAVYSLDTNEDGVPDVNQVIVTLSFDANGGQYPPNPIIFVVGTTTDGKAGVKVPEDEPTWEYHTFLGWGERPDDTKDDKLYKVDADKTARRYIDIARDTTLYAVWMDNYKIKYDANGGENAPDPTVLVSMTRKGTDSKGNPVYSGQAEITSDIPTRTGYTFRGWGVTRRSAASYFAGDRVEISGGDVTLYAVWTRGTNGGDGKPKTGDDDVGVYTALLCVSAAGLAATGGLLWKKRRGEA